MDLSGGILDRQETNGVALRNCRDRGSFVVALISPVIHAEVCRRVTEAIYEQCSKGFEYFTLLSVPIGFERLALLMLVIGVQHYISYATSQVFTLPTIDG